MTYTMTYKTLRDFDLKGKKVLLRADLNVPKHHNDITDATRIDRLKGTIDFLHQKGAKTLILSHFGRPDGEQNPQMSLAFLAPVLTRRWGLPVKFSQDCVGIAAQNATASLKDGEILLLENVRFYKEEEKNDPAFAARLATLGDIYINDAFSAAHRAHASTEGLAHLLPSAAGLLMEEELSALSSALDHPQKPVLAVAGGSKISTKLNVLNNLIEKVDFLVLGGGMANTFLHAQGIDMKKSLCEKNMADQAKDILTKAKNIGCEIILPRDLVVAAELGENAPHKTVPVDQIPDDHMAIDAGEESTTYICDKIAQSRTILWNGPLGVFEIKPFDTGTNTVAAFVGAQTKNGACTSVAGGGDTVAALENAGAAKDFSYISTAGGAFLEWLEGKTLPGVQALLHSTQNPKSAQIK